MKKYLIILMLFLTLKSVMVCGNPVKFETKKDKIMSLLKGTAFLSLSFATGYLALKSFKVYNESIPRGNSELWTSKLYNTIIGDGDNISYIPVIGKLPKIINSVAELRHSLLVFAGGTGFSSLLFGAVGLKYISDIFRKNKV